MVQAPPQRVEMRYKKDQDKQFFTILEAFKSVKPAEKEQLKTSSALGMHN